MIDWNKKYIENHATISLEDNAIKKIEHLIYDKIFGL